MYYRRRRRRRRNPFLEETIHPSALSFDPEASIQTGALSFDPDDASTEIFSEERADELAAQELLEAMQSDLNWQKLGKAVARSWNLPGIGGMLSRRLRRAFLSNPKVQEAAQHMAEIWVEETNKMLMGSSYRHNPRRGIARWSKRNRQARRRSRRNWDCL